MPKNAKGNLNKALDELCCCQNHLNAAYMQADDEQNKNSIHAALKSVGSAIDSAQNTLLHYKD